MSPTTKTKLTELAQAGVSIGTSSWKYPGWCGQLYDEQRYLTRKKFSKAKFDEVFWTHLDRAGPTCPESVEMDSPSDGAWSQAV
ncbi:MAG: hypothetical protein ABJF10_13965 [Chthoniobacter sp.]|uniref:hypothetical protein n=1 Tax=Chthoniobacter sp. TaxID=2510640 RepID=UPI0032A6AE63